ncbi:MAG: DUF2520 domain-containing protein [Gammaproteobacteria bacterium]|nr:DUF2520 domain-containing protein [Gammaproteobacteria bacterium]
MLTVGFVGCGRAGRVLGHLWHRGGVFRIGPVLTRSPASAADAVRRIGAGTPLESPAGLAPADVLVLATPDRFLADAAAGLAGSGAVALHLSGALPSALLREAGLGGPVAGIHPAHSFGDFAHSVRSFGGTWCACEGDEAALEVLKPAFAVIGGRPFAIDPGRKLAYHAAGVMATNYLNALAATSLDTFVLAGIGRDTASALLAPVLRGVVENIVARGPGASLTGPIARGDRQLVEAELDLLRRLDPALAEVYRVMGRRTLTLAMAQGELDPDAAAGLEAVLGTES